MAESDSDRTKAYIDIATYYQSYQKDSAQFYLRKGYEEFLRKKNPKAQAAMLVALGGIYATSDMFSASSKMYNAALPLLRKAGDSANIAWVYNGLGIIEGKSGHFENATRYFFAALRIFEKTNNQHDIASTYLKLGLVNQLTGNFRNALRYYNQALPIALKTDTSDAVTILNNIGTIYNTLKHTDTAVMYYSRAMQFCEEERYTLQKILPLTNLGNIYRDSGNTQKALLYFDEGIRIASAQHAPEDAIRLQMNRADIMYRSSPTTAKTLIYHALKSADSLHLRYLEMEILDDLIRINRKEKKYEEIVRLQEMLQQVKDSMYSIGKAAEISNVQAGYEQERFDHEIEDLNNQSRRAAEERRIAVFASLLLATLLLSSVYFYIKLRKSNQKLVLRRRELDQANTIKDKLFSIIGHDLRSAIGSQHMLLELYKGDQSTEGKEFFLEALQINAVAATNTLETLLNWGKSQIKGITLNQTEFRVKGVLDDNIKLMNATAAIKHITIVNHIPDDISIYADKDHFTFVVRNLIANAIKFSEEGAAVYLDADRFLQAGFIIFSVSDTGIGIAVENQKDIFDPFHTGSKGTAQESGNGIGLMLCKEFIEKNGGSIWVESEVGKGSTFKFSMKKSHLGDIII